VVPFIHAHNTQQGLGKLVMLRARLGAAAGAVKNFFTGGKGEPDPAVVAMENLRVSGGVCV
jgi:hypothetical protein